MNRPRKYILALLLSVSICSPDALAGAWRAGVGRSNITPTEPVQLIGYAARTQLSEGVLHDIFVKALAIEDPAGQRFVLITMDLLIVPREVAAEVSDRLKADRGISRERIRFCASHTHTGPGIARFSFKPMPEDDENARREKAYTKFVTERMIQAAEEALDHLQPAALAWGNGKTTFAVNRRTNKEAKVPELIAAGALAGPVDHDAPVLKVSAADGKVIAIAFGYACHNTTLQFLKVSGDYAGFAQSELEKMYPGAQAMFFEGCGGDQNPLPRKTVELAEKYGKQLATAVGEVVGKPMRDVDGPITAKFATIDLAYEDAKRPPYPYPIQVWQMGKALTWISLGGEPVVDYSLRFKKEFGPERTWVTGYSNDVMGYIPSLRVWNEGGYEAQRASYGFDNKWAKDVEEIISAKVSEMVRAARIQ